jgi:predicted sulfurtransferase
MKSVWMKLLPAVILACFLMTGCAQPTDTAKDAKPAAAVKKEKNVYKGKVVGKSNKAKTISIKVGKGAAAKTMMVKFNDATQGVEHAAKGHAAIIKYKVVGTDKIATVIKPKLAKMPEGVTEIKTAEMEALLTHKTEMMIFDARPASRYAQGHLPGAVSLPVPQLAKEGELALPKDKDLLLVFYCGGPT